MDAEGLGGLADELHHGHRADGENLVILHAAFQQLLQLHGAEALLAVGAVVGHQVQVGGSCPEFLLQDDDVLGAEADDDVHNGAGLQECLGCRQRDGAANAAAHHADALLVLHIGGTAQGAHKVADVVALVQGAQRVGGEADLLEDDGDGALLPVTAGDGQGHALALLVNAEDDELACLCLAGNEGGLDVHHGDGGIQFLFANDFVHNAIRPFYDMFGFGETVDCVRFQTTL